jgi:hypothetical protein
MTGRIINIWISQRTRLYFSQASRANWWYIAHPDWRPWQVSRVTQFSLRPPTDYMRYKIYNTRMETSEHLFNPATIHGYMGRFQVFCGAVSQDDGGQAHHKKFSCLSVTLQVAYLRLHTIPPRLPFRVNLFLALPSFLTLSASIRPSEQNGRCITKPFALSMVQTWWESHLSMFLLYLTTLSQLRRLYSVEWEDNCEKWMRKDVEGHSHVWC